MWPDRGSNPGPLALESDALPTTLLDPALMNRCKLKIYSISVKSSQYLVIMKDCVQGNPVYGLKVFRLERNSTPGARFTKHLKPKIFLSAIQIVWHLRKS